jgi:hypothetical protein
MTGAVAAAADGGSGALAGADAADRTIAAAVTRMRASTTDSGPDQRLPKTTSGRRTY